MLLIWFLIVLAAFTIMVVCLSIYDRSKAGGAVEFWSYTIGQVAIVVIAAAPIVFFIK